MGAGALVWRVSGELSSGLCPQIPAALRDGMIFTDGSRPLFSLRTDGVFKGTGAIKAVGAAAPPIALPLPLLPRTTVIPAVDLEVDPTLQRIF